VDEPDYSPNKLVSSYHAPTIDHSEKEGKEFYSLKDLIKKLPELEILMLMGDFNA